MATIEITNLRLRTIIGINDWERVNKQDIVINITIDYDASQSAVTDRIEDTLDYKALTKKIIHLVENTQFFLLEKLTRSVLDIVLAAPLVLHARVRIEKPLALRFADSVSVELKESKNK